MAQKHSTRSAGWRIKTSDALLPGQKEEAGNCRRRRRAAAAVAAAAVPGPGPAADRMLLLLSPLLMLLLSPLLLTWIRTAPLELS